MKDDEARERVGRRCRFDTCEWRGQEGVPTGKSFWLQHSSKDVTVDEVYQVNVAH